LSLSAYADCPVEMGGSSTIVILVLPGTSLTIPIFANSRRTAALLHGETIADRRDADGVEIAGQHCAFMATREGKATG
jgi:hypothetical protein